MSLQNEHKRRIAPLDGWRTISVALVVLSHLATFSSIALDGSGTTDSFFWPIFYGCGYLGVNIFFVMSGYVIMGGLIREHACTGRISISNFYLRRVLRIIPPLLTYVLVIFCLARSDVIPHDAVKSINALTFTCNIALLDCGGWFGEHTWSLACEMQFYLIIPFLFFLLWKNRSILFLCLPVVVTVVTLCTYPLNEKTAAFLGNFIAISAGVAWASQEVLVLKVCRKIPPIAAIAVPFLLLALQRLIITRYAPLAGAIVPILIIFMLVYSTFLSESVAKLLSHPILTYIGRASYGVYIWQQLATFNFPGVGIGFYVASVGLAVLFACASYMWIEAPLISISHVISKRLSHRLSEIVSIGHGSESTSAQGDGDHRVRDVDPLFRIPRDAAPAAPPTE